MCSIDKGSRRLLNAVKARSRKGEALDDPDLNKRSFSFVIRSEEELRSGDVVVVREVRDRGNGEREVVAVPERAILQEAQKIFAT